MVMVPSVSAVNLGLDESDLPLKGRGLLPIS
jgi:hypothetical protein